MRTLGAIILALALLAQVNTASAQSAAPAPAVAHTDYRPLVIGLGAIAGVVVFNVAALGLEAIPGGLAYEAGATVPAEMSVAISRVYATTAAVVGGLLAYYTLAR
jgi:hypothetical protein